MLIGWQSLYHLKSYKVLSSTSDIAREELATKDINPTVIWAEEQTHGRGRSGKSWQSAEGNLYFSFFDLTEYSVKDSKMLCFVAALSVHGALSKIMPPHNLPLQIKWPNDILIDGKKIVGILVERINHRGKYYTIIGVGVNVTSAPELEGRITCSLVEYGILASNYDVLNNIMHEFCLFLERYKIYGSTIITDEINKHLYKKGEVITLQSPNDRITGICEAINNNGELLIRTELGEIITADNGSLE